MVFYYTSSNIKILKNIWLDYEDAEETSPYEYMKTYIEKCPSTVDDHKLTWIAETFLGHKKHFAFLRDIATYLSEELSEDEQDFFIIFLYALTFQVEPKDMELIYKSMFNLSKQLLSTFTAFLSNNEMLIYISQVAQVYYDAKYVTDKIIAPLFVWQPYISEMAHNYAEHIKKAELRKIKPLTVPVQPTVLNRKGKEPAKVPSQPSLPPTPPNSVYKNRKMLTKSTIDRRLKTIHEKNKQAAANLLNIVKNDNFHYARQKTEGSYKKLSYDDSQSMQTISKPKKIVAQPSIPVRDNIAVLKRLNARAQMTEQEEVQWVKDMLNCRQPREIHTEELMELERQEQQKSRLYEIEKKHLMGQISYEEAILAKKKVEDENKKKYEEFLKEKQKWERALNDWKMLQLTKNRTNFENILLGELSTIEARNAVLDKNKEIADKVKKESELRKAELMKQKQEDLDYKIRMVKEIKILSTIAKKSKVPKIIDLTETSRIGLLCEMSIAELQERLASLKMYFKEELQKKQAAIHKEHDEAKKEIEDTKEYVKSFIQERTMMRKQNKINEIERKRDMEQEIKSSKAVHELKKLLEEKRKLRTNLEISKSNN